MLSRNTLSEKVFETVRDKSYFHLIDVLFEENKKRTKGRNKDENWKLCIYSCRYAYKLEESKAYVLVINGHSLHTT